MQSDRMKEVSNERMKDVPDQTVQWQGQQLARTETTGLIEHEQWGGWKRDHEVDMNGATEAGMTGRACRIQSILAAPTSATVAAPSAQPLLAG